MEEKRIFFSRLKPILKQPWFYFFIFEFLYMVYLKPLQEHPKILYPFLSESLFDFCREYLGDLLALVLLSIVVVSIWLLGVYLFRRKFGNAVAYLFVVLFLLAPSLLREHVHVAREKTKRISCYSNLKQLLVAIELYVDMSGNLPPDLKTLETSGIMIDRRILRCPSRVHPNPEYSDYEYYGKGRRLYSEKSFLLIEDWSKNHAGNYRNRMYSDGSITTEVVK